MSLEKFEVVDLIEVTENNIVQVRTATRIVEDGNVISQTYRRSVVEPGQDYSQEDSRVQAICAAVQTSEVVAAFQAAQEATKPQLAE